MLENAKITLEEDNRIKYMMHHNIKPKIKEELSPGLKKWSY